MRFLFQCALVLSTMILACTPKTGDKTASTASKPPISQVMPAGKAPTIPLPTGDIRKTAPKAGDAPKIQIGKAESFQLANGLKVIVVENHKLPKVTYRIFVDHDPILEKDAVGYVQLMGEMLTKGTKTREKAKIDEDIDFIGAYLVSESTGISGGCLTKHADKLLTLMSDALLNPLFSQEELDKAKVRQQSDLASAKDDAGTIAGNVSSVLKYGKGHPYGEIMTETTLAKVNLDQIKAHYNAYFKPNISYLVVTGDVTKAQIEKQANKYFGKWQKGEVKENLYAAPIPPEKTVVNFVNKAGAVQSVINITYPVDLQPGTPDVIRARVTNAILGGYFNSRVNANLREGRGWTYGAGTSLNPDELIGSFTASASVRNAVTDSSIIEFVKEMDRMRTEKVGKEELQVVKNVLAGQFSQSLETPGTVANFALTMARFGLPADYYEKYLEVLQAVTAEEVMAMAKKYIRTDKAHILVVGNMSDVADRLKQFATDKTIKYYDAYGNESRNINTNIPPGVTAERILEDYVNAIGGAANIAAIKDLQSTASMEMGGPKFVITTFQKGGDKILIEMTMAGQPLSKRILNGSKGMERGMGGAETAMKESDLNDLKEQAKFCKESEYVKNGYKLTLKGIEEVSNGVAAYVIDVVRGDGKTITEYYEVKSSLKLREISMTEGQSGALVPLTTDFEDYKPINNVQIPHKITVGGILPTPFKVIVSEIKANAGLDDGLFK